MPSFEQPVADNKIVIAVALSRGAGEPTVQFSALFDTGAQVTAISPEVVRSLDLMPTGRLGLTVASGQTVDTFQYRRLVLGADSGEGHAQQAPDFCVRRGAAASV